VDEVFDFHLRDFELLPVDFLMDENVRHQRMVAYQRMILVEWLVYRWFHHYRMDLLHELYKLLDHLDVQQEFVM
jgi:hypothetical protein